jgi:hypothetical protein
MWLDTMWLRLTPQEALYKVQHLALYVVVVLLSEDKGQSCSKLCLLIDPLRVRSEHLCCLEL